MAAIQDKGFSWIICICSFMNLLMTGGFYYTTGIFYIMFKNGLNAGDSELSLITSLNAAATLGICPLAGILTARYGERRVSITGAMLATVARVSSSFCTQVYQLYIFYGLLSGAGMGMVLNPSISILNKYFNKYKQTACGLALCGLGFGSFIYPPMIKVLEDTYGWRGALIIISGVSANTMVFCSFFRPIQHDDGPQRIVDIQTNSTRNQSQHFRSSSNMGEMQHKTEAVPSNDCEIKKPKNETSGNSGGKVSSIFSIFRIIPFSCIIASTLMVNFSVSIINTHFGSYVLSLGHTSEDAVLLYTTMGLSSTIGRPLVGIIAQVTHANSAVFVMCSTMILGILTIMLPLANQLWLIYVYGVSFQLLMAPFFILNHSINMEYVPKSHLAFAVGVVHLFGVPGNITGPPIAAMLYDVTRVYSYIFFMAGPIFILVGLIMAPGAYYIHNVKSRDKIQHI